MNSIGVSVSADPPEFGDEISLLWLLAFADIPADADFTYWLCEFSRMTKPNTQKSWESSPGLNDYDCVRNSDGEFFGKCKNAGWFQIKPSGIFLINFKALHSYEKRRFIQ